MSFSSFVRAAVIGTMLAAVAAGPGCAVDEAPGGVRKANKTGGPQVRFDLGHRPLPEIPLPNDIATWPDPTSRTGRRINASLVATTSIERNARSKFSELEGWGTFSSISIPFNKPLDAEDVRARHAEDDFKFDDDVIYVVNLKTGVPVPLDMGGGNFPITLRELSRYWPNDPRKGEANIMFETVEEDKNGNGILDPGEDTDFDGVLDHPNFPNRARPANGVDGLYTFYESETNTLIARPMIPLDEMTEYAVVITDRLHGADNKAVESPFEYIHHPAQRAAVERAVAAMGKRPEYYGFSGSTLDHVQFVFTFTTQPTVSDMFALRDGAYGKGKFGWIGEQYKPEFTLIKAVGRVGPDDDDPAGWQTSTEACTQQGDKTRLIAKMTPALKSTLKDLAGQVFGLSGPSANRLIEGYENVDYIAAGYVEVPWLLGDINNVSPEAYMRINHQTGEIPHTRTKVPYFLIVPKKTDKFKPPFPVTYYGHGYTGNFAEGLGFAAELARHGVATVAMTAPGHGLAIDDGMRALARNFFGGACLQPLGAGVFGKEPGDIGLDRTRDLNGDGVFDESGQDYWTSYLFHTRDIVRQAALEEVMVTRAMREFGKANPDGSLAGDFDGDGVPDIGGPNGKFYAWGGSLGGILSSLAGAVDPYITATAPMAGGGALTDVGIRSFQGGVVEAVDLRMMGPLVISVPAESRFDCSKNTEGKCRVDPEGKTIIAPKENQTRTACDAGQMSIRWVAVDLNDDKEFEIACVSRDEFAEGNDVIVGNMTNGEVRCAQVMVGQRSDGGPISDSGKPEFRVPIPATVGDQIIIAAYKPPPGKKQAVKQYGKTCELEPGATQVKVIDKWAGIGFECQKVAGDKCMKFQTAEFPIGSKLVAISEGYGIKRQTPDLRRLMQLAQIALDPADPVTFAPYYYSRPRLDENGKQVGPAGIYTINTIGDMNVPVNTGIAAARIHGAIPFLRFDNIAAKDYPDYTAPEDLINLYNGDTPNRFLLKNHVIEGIRWLKRHPAPGCKTNDSGIEGCDASKDYDPRVCEEALFDPENLDEGKNPIAPQKPATPLRLARLAKPGSTPNVWAPRLQAAKGGWTGNETLAGVVNAFIVPEGIHGFDPPDPCKQWDTGMYLVNVVGRFFSTGATDIPYITNPTGHTCAGVTDWRKPEACVWK